MQSETKIKTNVAKEIAKIAFPQPQEPLKIERKEVPTTTTIKVTPRPTVTGDAKMFIYMKESGNNPYAINASSGACGLGQALPCSKMGCALGDYACQDAWFTNYMLSRYGTWENARAFWLVKHWW